MSDQLAGPYRRERTEMDKDNGGPAFPHLGNEYNNDSREREIATTESGMTIRDYFAAKAMGGFASDPSSAWKDGAAGMARCSYDWADAMLVARAG